MNKSYRVKVTGHARISILEIAEYILFELKAPNAANNFVKLIEKSIESLNVLPERFILVQEEPWNILGIHRMIIKQYSIYFWINDNSNVVYVTDVVLSKREQIQILKKMPLE